MKRSNAFLLALSLFLCACGSSHTPAASSASISGNWQMSLQKSNSSIAPKTQAGFLLQNSDAVTGSVVFIDTPCSGIGSVSGSVTGSNISLTVNPTGTTIILSGTIGSDQASMSGDYTILSTGCTGSQSSPQMGTWTADLVTPLNGNVQGTFISTPHGTTVNVTGQLTQGPNTGSSLAPITGTLSLAGYCYPTATVVGSISGTSVAINLLNTDGTSFGEVDGVTSLDGTTINGTYRAVGQGSGAAKNCVDGDSGSVTITL